MPEMMEVETPAIEVAPEPQLKDDKPPVDYAAELEKVKKEKDDLAGKVTEWEKQKETYEQRLADSQKTIRDAMNIQQRVQQESPGFEGYLKEVDTICENDGPQRAVRKVITDMAFDRDAERKEMAKRIEQAENNAYQRMLKNDPGYSELAKDADNLAKESEVFAGMTTEQRMEIVKHNRKQSGNKSAAASFAGNVGNGGIRSGGTKTGRWMDDPSIQKEAVELGFESKAELEQFSDPRKADAFFKAKWKK